MIDRILLQMQQINMKHGGAHIRTELPGYMQDST